MSDVTFEDVFAMAKQLEPAKRLLLAMRLEESVPTTERADAQREALISELEQLRAAGAFDHVESLYGKYANSNVPEMSAEDFHAELHAIATEWEQELDQFDPTND